MNSLALRPLTPDALSGTITPSPAAALLPVPLHPAGRMSILTTFPARRPDELRKMGSHPAKKRNTSLLVKAFMPTKKIQVNLRELERIMAEDDGHFITLFACYLCKCFMIKHLEARGVEPLFR